MIKDRVAFHYSANNPDLQESGRKTVSLGYSSSYRARSRLIPFTIYWLLLNCCCCGSFLSGACLYPSNDHVIKQHTLPPRPIKFTVECTGALSIHESVNWPCHRVKWKEEDGNQSTLLHSGLNVSPGSQSKGIWWMWILNGIDRNNYNYYGYR